MTATDSTAVDTEGRTLVIERIFDAPRELVWRAWTEPEHLQRWWGPKDFTAPGCTLDLREGGRYHFCMRSPDGQEIWSTGVFREIVPLERIVATDCFADADGNVVPASYYGLDEEHPLELLLTVAFEDAGAGRTRLTVQHAGLPESVTSDASQGWNESLDKLADTLAAA